MEYQVGNRGIILDKCKPNESIYIFACKDSVIQVQGKSAGPFHAVTRTCTCTASVALLQIGAQCLLSLFLIEVVRQSDCGRRTAFVNLDIIFREFFS